MIQSSRRAVFLILVFCLGAIGFGQDKQVTQDKQLREEIIAAYQSGGERGLLDSVKKNKEKISDRFILGFAGAAVKKREEEWLNVCNLLAEEKKDEKLTADVLYQIGKYSMLTGDNQKATDCLDRAFPIYLKLDDSAGLGDIILGRGWMFLHAGERSRAFEMFDKAFVFFKKAGHLVGLGNVHMNKGTVYLYAGDNPNALKMYNKAVTFFEKAGYAPGLGAIFQNKGTIYLNTGQLKPALEMYEKALPFFEREHDLRSQGVIYWNKGQVYLRTGKNTKAAQMLEKARTLFEQSKAPQGQGRIYLARGVAYSNAGENSKALVMLNKAMVFFENSGDTVGRGGVYHSKGHIYFSIGDNSKALEMCDKALPLFENAGVTFSIGNTFLSKGMIYNDEGDASTALEMYKKALSFYEKTGEPISQGNVYLYMADIYNRPHGTLKALEIYNKALSFYEKAKHPAGQCNVLNSKGTIFFKMGEYSKALDMYNKASKLYNIATGIGTVSTTLHFKGRVFAELGKKKKALEFYEQGIANNEKIRSRTAFSKMKKTFMEKNYQQYQETVLFMLENKFYTKGFRYAESMRSRVFLDRMAEGWVRLDKGLHSELKEKRDNLVTKLSLLSKEMHETTAEKGKKKLTSLKDRYRKVESELEDLLIKIRLDNPLYARVRYPQPISVRALQKDVLKKGELLLRYFIAPEKTYAFLVSKKRFKVIALNTAEKELKGMISTYLHALAEKDSSRIKRYGNSLYRELFKPLEPEIKKSKEIFIIPDGQLATIPFESLIIDKKKSGRPVFLLEKHRVKYLQSASLLSVLRKHYSGDTVRKNFTGFGDPVYDYKAFKQAGPEQAELTAARRPEGEIRQVLRSCYSRSGGTFDRLPASGEEVRAIAGLFKKHHHKATVFTGIGATEENAKAPQMKGFDYIHFACHGLLNENFQSLVLSQLPREKSTEDGYFTLNEIMNCDYHAKLIVLSACKTGSGKMERAEGVTGLTRAVMYAGTPAVVASLWNVDDRATKELMLYFYRNLLEKNLTKSEALRQAKLELMKHKKYRSPYFWSAFVMYGE